MTARLVVDDGFPTPAGTPKLEEMLAAVAHRQLEVQYMEVERRLLAGEDRVEVTGPNGGTLVYEVPGWTEHPIRRFRIALARRSASRSS